MNKFVMLVEDDLDLREDLSFLLSQEGYRVETASNGAEAIERLETLDVPGLIILDLMMPVMDGWQTRAALLERPRLAEVPVILLSGIADIQDEARSMGVAGYLKKPIDLDKLYSTVADHCAS